MAKRVKVAWLFQCAMKKKKFNEINSRVADMYVQCSLNVTGKETSEWGYTFSMFGEFINISEELTANEVHELIACLTAALKATGEWTEEGGDA